MSNSTQHYIGIIGCGWLGKPLAQAFIKNGFKVKGSTTRASEISVLESLGIKPYHLIITENEINGPIQSFLEDCQTLIINIPPGLRKNPNKSHHKEIKNLISAVESSEVENLLFVSSIGVFKDREQVPIIEQDSLPDAESKTGLQLIKTEASILKITGVKSSILRLAGLFDEIRHPGKSLSGRTQLPNPLAPLNLIHKQDCINIILEIVKQQRWGALFNAAFPYHPSKENYYTEYCKRHQLPIPTFNHQQASKGKIINSDNLERLLNLRLAHKP